MPRIVLTSAQSPNKQTNILQRPSCGSEGGGGGFLHTKERWFRECCPIGDEWVAGQRGRGGGGT